MPKESTESEKMNIPSDWDGESWCCQVVEWPNSVEWQAILTGFLSYPARGRFWDGSTGLISEAQATGREIIERNCIFVSPGE